MTLEELRALYGSAPASTSPISIEVAPSLDVETLRKLYVPAESIAPLAPPPIPELSPQSLRQRLAAQPVSFEPLAGSREGFVQGVNDVASTLAQGAEYVDKRVPLLAALDRAFGIDPDKLAESNKKDVVSRDEFNKKYQDNLAAQAGRVIGQTALTLPIIGGAGAAVRAGGQALGVGGLANYLTGGSNVIGSGLLGNIGAGTLATGLTASQSDEPLADQLKQGAATSAVLGAGAGALGSAYNLGRALYRTAKTGTPEGINEFANNLINGKTKNPLIVDTSEIVPGSPRTLADATGDPNIARIQKGMRNDPAYVEDFKRIEDLQNQARQNFYTQNAGDPKTIAALEADREAARAFDTAGLWQPNQVAQTAPVVNAIDKILTGPSGMRSTVKDTLEKVRKQLVVDGPNGSQQLVANPQQLYESARKEIGDLLDKDLARTSVDSSKALKVSGDLQGIRDKLDDVIDKAAPGFKQYMQNYEQASGPISAQRYLQELNLTDATGNFTLSKVKNALDDIHKMRRQPGINGAKNLSDEQINMMERIHQDLLNKHNVYNTVKAYGSDTQPNLLMQHILQGVTGADRVINPGVLGSTLGGVAGHLTGDSAWGTLLGSGLGAQMAYGLQHGLSGREIAVRNALADKLVNPSTFSPQLPAQAPGMSLSLAPGFATPALNPNYGDDANSLLRRVAPQVPGL